MNQRINADGSLSYALKGSSVSLSVAPLTTFDLSVLHALIDSVQDCSKRLGLDFQWLDTFASFIKTHEREWWHSNGVREWVTDKFIEIDPGHRHFSHMFALFPGWQVKPGSAMETAFTRALSRRMDNKGGHTGWSSAWAMNLYARLRDGEGFIKTFKKFTRKYILPNFLGIHPRLAAAKSRQHIRCVTCREEISGEGVFQIDANMGVMNAIVETLLQSHAGVITLLPGLPKDWVAGEVKGVRARGGYQIDIVWEDGRLQGCVVRLVNEFQPRTSKVKINIPVKRSSNKYALSVDGVVKENVTAPFELEIHPHQSYNLIAL